MRSIKPTPEIELARGTFRWWPELQSWLLATEAGTPPTNPKGSEHRSLVRAQLVFTDCAERIGKILNPEGDPK